MVRECMCVWLVLMGYDDECVIVRVYAYVCVCTYVTTHKLLGDHYQVC